MATPDNANSPESSSLPPPTIVCPLCSEVFPDILSYKGHECSKVKTEDEASNDSSKKTT